MAGFRIAIGGDDAGFAYKETLTKDLNADDRVSEVIDVGPNSASDKKAYPHFAIAAAELVAQGKADRARKDLHASLSCRWDYESSMDVSYVSFALITYGQS